MRVVAAVVVLAAALVGTPPAGRAAGWVADTPRLVRDINEDQLGSFPQMLTPVGDVLFFSASTGALGRELWRSGGRSGTTRPVRDLNPGPASSILDFGDRIAALRDRVLFAADDGVSGMELWGSDGTEAGTTLVKDIDPAGSAYPEEFVAVGGILYFSADDGTNGRELWQSDGTPQGTRMVSDIYPGEQGSSPDGFTAVLLDPGRPPAVLFAATSQLTGRELWRTDGTAQGTALVRDIAPGVSSAPTNLTDVDGMLFFSANHPVHGRELWRSDGTSAGTVLVKDIWPGLEGELPASSSPSALSDLDGPGSADGTVLFTTDDGTVGRELWSSDGTPENTRLVRDIQTGPASSGPAALTGIGSMLYFSAEDQDHGRELWSSDGSRADLVRDLEPGADSSISDPFLTDDLFAVLGGALIFPADTGARGEELWRSDGTPAGTTLVKDPGDDWYPDDLTEVGERVFFAANRPSTGRELWRTDGTAPGTYLVDDAATGSAGSSPTAAVFVRGTAFFTADDGISGRELWKSNGTQGGTSIVRELAPGRRNSVAGDFDMRATASGILFFFGYTEELGMELWRTDGTAAGTWLVKDVNPGTASSTRVGRMLAMGDTVYFDADDGTNGVELWRSDGTAGGTRRVADVRPGPGSSRPDTFATVGSTVYFTADDGQHGVELWRTQGEGAQLVTDIAPGGAASGPRSLTDVTGRLFFAASDGNGDRELWTVPGPEAGAARVADILPVLSSVPRDLTALGGTLLFTAQSTLEGRELWRSDGTHDGTVVVRDIAPGTASSMGPVPYLRAVGQAVYFTADDGQHGQELWRSDGTTVGTALVRDLAPGSSWSSPAYMTALGERAYFAASDGVSGTELWRSDGTHDGTVLAGDVLPGSTSSYPRQLSSGGGVLFFEADGVDVGREPWILRRGS